MNNISFPVNLLTESIENRVNYFRNFTVVHPHLHQSYEDLKHAVKYSTPGSLIFLYGPSGVGKTTLLQKLYEDIIEETYQELIEDPAKLPAVFIMAVAADGNSFDWKDYFHRLLKEMNDILPDKKIDDRRWEKLNGQNSKILKDDRASAPRYRKAVENNVEHRKPLCIIVDEAQEIGTVSTGRKILRQTNVLKSIAEKTNTNHILSGTYELLPLRNLNGQLSRRSIEIHFPRYDARNNDQRVIFRGVLRTFQRHLPFREVPDLVSDWEYLFERSVGCIGTLKDWLTRSLSWALEKNQLTLTLCDLQKREPSVAQAIRSLEEILEGEKNLKKENGQRLKLREALGLNISEPPLKSLSITTPKKKNKRVGVRRPKRDAIGTSV